VSRHEGAPAREEGWPDPAGTIALTERAAAAWLTLHPWQAAQFDHPEFSARGASTTAAA
jgi:hypothetical protein